MAKTLENALVIAVSSRALLDFEQENRIFDQNNDAAYVNEQFEKIDQIAPKGAAFHLVEKLLSLNENSESINTDNKVEVVILSRNDPVSGLRVFNSAHSLGLKIERGIFTSGRPPFGYLRPLRSKLFLSAHKSDVRAAIDAGLAAAEVIPKTAAEDPNPKEIRIAFDGDSVLFSDEAEQIFQASGLTAFQQHETARADIPLPAGPLWPLLNALHKLRMMQSRSAEITVRIGLFTARSAPSHERAIKTFVNAGITIDEAVFLGGLEKGPFLREFEPDMFFDDQSRHIENALAVTSVGHVPFGSINARLEN